MTFTKEVIILLSLSVSLVISKVTVTRFRDRNGIIDVIKYADEEKRCLPSQTALKFEGSFNCIYDIDILTDLNTTVTHFKKEADVIWSGPTFLEPCSISLLKYKEYRGTSWKNVVQPGSCFLFHKILRINLVLTRVSSCKYEEYLGKLIHVNILCEKHNYTYNIFSTLPSNYISANATVEVFTTTTEPETKTATTTTFIKIPKTTAPYADKTKPSLTATTGRQTTTLEITTKIIAVDATTATKPEIKLTTNLNTHSTKSHFSATSGITTNEHSTGNATIFNKTPPVEPASNPIFISTLTASTTSSVNIKDDDDSSKIILIAALASSLVLVVLLGCLIYMFWCRKRKSARENQDLLVTAMMPLDDDVFNPTADISSLYTVPKKIKKKQVLKLKKGTGNWSNYDEVGALIEGVYEAKESISEDQDGKNSVNGYSKVDMRMSPPAFVQDGPYEFIGSRTNSFTPGRIKDNKSLDMGPEIVETALTTPENTVSIPLVRENPCSQKEENSAKVSTFKPNSSIRIKQQRTSMRRENFLDKENAILTNATHEDVTITPPVSKRSSPVLSDNRRLVNKSSNENTKQTNSYETIPKDNVDSNKNAENDSKQEHHFFQLEPENDDENHEYEEVASNNDTSPISYADVEISPMKDSDKTKTSNRNPNYVSVQVAD
ncbi:uncharacterized protein LOC130645544 [Hydractinia symbiolongicarpus]|uniref:uncharacterized protein LOC130645544 n=1 Tax=Hydractinia symbiolongicarpus TaxID=13093 RepID=UPI00254E2FA4|nr:uncharacterized protein LOC130645544 [Hydractinia symbiolongicarpus]XP_057307559.1 uncharacterized protein LOC130645544 [Hydractinia symbiolongicarpus]XP_057307567.1 uncharacterized protein LOC130645544 [Hydractinia symbiolongicarpus]